MRKLTIGKIRGLQQISTPEGIFIICAMDHRGSLKTMIEREQLDGEVDYQELVEHKLELCSILAPHTSAVLLDPNYGAAQCIAAGVLPGSSGLLVSIEATGYESAPGGRITTLLDGWSVEKIKRMGGSAVKMLVYYRPDLTDLASKQSKTIQMVAEECFRFDIPFLVEPKTYAVSGEDAKSQQFAAQKPRLVIETARQISSLPIDVLKAEFPADMSYEMNRASLYQLCQQLDEASEVPWVLLSAGVDYETFRQEVEIACQAGASGFLGGRAIWQEAVRFGDKKERVEFLSTTVVDRLKELAEIAAKYAIPWYRKLGVEAHKLAEISESWYKGY
ncbi:MAG TPA: tagatose 1,6-diphosphate aldolase [Dehalococcoidia bacterium]|nr:tagatose 1,6-diphosphate aldolase [Dehalococcoidia bacterium]